jgi:hypothetical protein
MPGPWLAPTFSTLKGETVSGRFWLRFASFF